MVDPTETEIAAMRYASDMAGEYLESLEKTDLATMTEDEWMNLMEVIITGFSDSMARAVGGSDTV